MVVERKDGSSSTTAPGGGGGGGKLVKFVPFSEHSLEKIADRIAADDEARHGGDDDEQRQATSGVRQLRRRAGGTDKKGASDDRRKERRPNTAFQAGKQFPDKFGVFPPELYGRPIEDLDEFYGNKYVSACTFNL